MVMKHFETKNVLDKFLLEVVTFLGPFSDYSDFPNKHALRLLIFGE